MSAKIVITPSRPLLQLRAKSGRAEHSPAVPREISSRDLLGGAREVWIRHGEVCYRLQHTRSGKLILTK